jgi:hypothetical protein
MKSLMSRYNNWLFRRADRRTLCGVSVGIVSGSHYDEDTAFAKVGNALELLSQYNAAVLGHLCRHVTGILVWETSWVWRSGKLPAGLLSATGASCTTG